MLEKQLRKVQITNLFLWGFAILLPIVAPAFASKEPKIFDVLIPILQLTLAGGSTSMFAALLKSAEAAHQDNDEAK